VLLLKVVVEADGKLVLGIGSAAVADKVVGAGQRVAGGVRLRPERANPSGDRVDAVVGNTVVGKREPGEGIENLNELARTGERAGEVAPQLLRRGYGEQLRQPAALAQTFIIKKPERPVVTVVKAGNDQSAAGGPSELVHRVERSRRACAIAEPV